MATNHIYASEFSRMKEEIRLLRNDVSRQKALIEQWVYVFQKLALSLRRKKDQKEAMELFVLIKKTIEQYLGKPLDVSDDAVEELYQQVKGKTDG